MRKIGIAIIFDREEDADKYGQSIIDWVDNEIKILSEGSKVSWKVLDIDRDAEEVLKLFRYLSENEEEEDTVEMDPSELEQ